MQPPGFVMVLMVLSSVRCADDVPVWTSVDQHIGSSIGGCQMLRITGSGFTGGEFSCLFKRGLERAVAPVTDRIGSLDTVVTCMVPRWRFEGGSVQLIVVRAGYGPISYEGGDTEGEMFEFLPEYRPVVEHPVVGPASGGTVVAFSSYWFKVGWSWYFCGFRRKLLSVNQSQASLNLEVGEVQKMNAPAVANEAHVVCTAPPWGSTYAADVHDSSHVSVRLYDGDNEIISHSTTETLALVLPSYCSDAAVHGEILFSPLWSLVLHCLIHILSCSCAYVDVRMHACVCMFIRVYKNRCSRVRACVRRMCTR